MKDKNLEQIRLFLDKHHVLSLATSNLEEISVCSLFYTYIDESLSFIVASSDETAHIQHLSSSNKVAGNILLETKTIGKIQGVQFRGKMTILEDKELKKLYFKAFPHAFAMHPKLWQIKVSYFKMTDNKLGFGKKIIWQEDAL